MQIAKNDELMQEICEFSVENEPIKFTGTFTHALELIRSR